MKQNLTLKSYPAKSFSLSERGNTSSILPKDATRHKPQEHSKFFDINYIFSDSFSLKKQKKPQSKIARRPNSTNTGRKQCNSTKDVPFDHQRMTEPIHRKSNLQKYNLFFNKNQHKSSIHSCRNNNNHIRASTLRDHNKTIEIQRTISNLLITKSFASGERQEVCKEATETKKKEKRGYHRTELNSQRETIDKQAQEKYDRSKEKQMLQKSSQMNVEWAKNALITRHKKIIKIYRPWSPVQFDQENLENSNTWF